MRRKLLSIILAIFLLNIAINPKVCGAANYTTLSEGSDFLFQLTSFADAEKALNLYRQFTDGISVQGFNYEQLAINNNMTSKGVVNADINQGSGNVGVVMSRINELFMNNLGCVLDTNATAVIQNVVQTGFNVNTSTSNYIVYSKKSGKSYTYVFKLLSGSFVDQGDKRRLTIVPTEIIVNVRISVKKILGITIDKDKDYDVHINANSYVFDF